MFQDLVVRGQFTVSITNEKRILVIGFILLIVEPLSIQDLHFMLIWHQKKIIWKSDFTFSFEKILCKYIHSLSPCQNTYIDIVLQHIYYNHRNFSINLFPWAASASPSMWSNKIPSGGWKVLKTLNKEINSKNSINITGTRNPFFIFDCGGPGYFMISIFCNTRLNFLHFQSFLTIHFTLCKSRANLIFSVVCKNRAW